jgi:hypothetical protein
MTTDTDGFKTHEDLLRALLNDARAEALAAEVAALRGLIQAHQLASTEHVKYWRQRAQALSGYKDTESVVERATLLDCASELDATLAAQPPAEKEETR